MTIWFTADTHCYHSNIIKHCNRPWLQEGDLDKRGLWVSSEIKYQRGHEMTEEIISRWNKLVSPSDTVYHLGDLCFLRDPDKINTLMSRLHGNIHLVLGNHDKTIRKERSRIQKSFASVRGKMQLKIDGIKISLDHYPYLSWNQSHRGSWHLHGHCHGSLGKGESERSRLISELIDKMYVCDVGVDVWDFHPVSFDTLKTFMEKKNA